MCRMGGPVLAAAWGADPERVCELPNLCIHYAAGTVSVHAVGGHHASQDLGAAGDPNAGKRAEPFCRTALCV